MKMLDALKKLVGKKPTPQPDPEVAPPAPEVLQPLANGRVAVLDARGNFVRFEVKGQSDAAGTA